MKKFVIINPTMDKFEELVAISYNVRLYEKKHKTANTIYHKQRIKIDLDYWENRLDIWHETNAKEIT